MIACEHDALGLLIGITLWMMASAATALACACCDFAISRKLVGWSKTGQSVLVKMSDDAACDHEYALEVWEVGSPQPTACFDLVHGPDQQITCDQLQPASAMPDKDGRDGQPRRSLVPRRFPRAVKQLPASRVRVTRSRTPRENDDEVGRDIDVVVAVKSGGKWHTVWDSAKAGIEPIFMQDGGLPKVRIFLRPPARRPCSPSRAMTATTGTAPSRPSCTGSRSHEVAGRRRPAWVRGVAVSSARRSRRWLTGIPIEPSAKWRGKVSE